MTDLDHHVLNIMMGDADAFGAWLSDGAEYALRRALTRYATSVDVEAVLQEALLRVWQVAPRFEPDGKPNSLLRFAHTVARNLALSEARRHAPALRLQGRGAPPSGEEVPIEPALPDPHLRAALERCREKLPEAPRVAFDARLAAGGHESDGSIAERLGLRKNTLLKRFGRARALLLACLEKAGVSIQEELA